MGDGSVMGCGCVMGDGSVMGCGCVMGGGSVGGGYGWWFWIVCVGGGLAMTLAVALSWAVVL